MASSIDPQFVERLERLERAVRLLSLKEDKPTRKIASGVAAAVLVLLLLAVAAFVLVRGVGDARKFSDPSSTNRYKAVE